MSDTTHKVLVKFEADTKGVEAGTARVAKEANKLSSQQKKQFGESFKRQKEVSKVSGPQQQKAATRELHKQNQEHRNTSRLLGQIAQQWNRVAQAAGKAWKASEGSGMDASRARRRAKQGTGFTGGFSAGAGFGGPGVTRYGIGHGLASGMRAGIGIAGGGLAALAAAPIAGISSDYQAYVSYQRSLGGLAGLNKGARFGSGLTVGGVGNTVNRMSALGYMPEDTINATRLFGRSTGSDAFTERGMTAAKVLGMDTSEVSGIFGDIRRGGGSFGESGMRDFQKVLQAAVKGGVDSSTLPEYLEGISSLTNRAGSAAGGAVSALPYAQLLAMFEKSGSAGLKGARGASVLSALEDGFKNPGGGAEGLAVVMGSLGFGRVGGNASYYQAKKMMQQGFQGPGGAGNLKNLFGYVDRITGGGEESNLYMEGLMGGRLTLDQIETVRGAMAKGGSEAEINKMLTEFTATELDVLKSIDANMLEFLGQGARASRIQKADIDRGAGNAESIERMQDIMQNFFNKMAPIIEDVLPHIATGLDFMVTGMTEMVTQISNLVDLLSPDDGSAAKAKAQQQDDIENENISKLLIRSSRGTDLSSEEEAMLSARANTILTRAQSQFGVSPDHLARGIMKDQYTDNDPAREHGLFLQNGLGRSQAQLISVLTTLLRERGINEPAIKGRIDTAEEIIAAMTALGISIPASARAQIDESGGVR